MFEVMKMLSKNILTQRDQLEMVAIEQLVPQNQLVRKMETALNFSFIYDEVKYLFGSGLEIGLRKSVIL